MNRPNKSSGFTLIELLIVVFIIGVLVTLISSNLIGGRSKARDAVKKENMRQFVNALRMYYNDYGNYPDDTSGFMGCGEDGMQVCPDLATCSDIEFSAGGSNINCSESTAYMKKFPKEFDEGEMVYAVTDSGQGFRLYVDLENSGDAAIAASQTRCTDPGGLYNSLTYVVCEK